MEDSPFTPNPSLKISHSTPSNLTALITVTQRIIQQLENSSLIISSKKGVSVLVEWKIISRTKNVVAYLKITLPMKNLIFFAKRDKFLMNIRMMIP